MDVKKVASFLLLKPVFSSRNMTSLALVAIFFGVYVAAGGKVSSIPKIETNGSFGGVSIPSPNVAGGTAKQATKPTTATSSLTDDLQDLDLSEEAPAGKSAQKSLGSLDDVKEDAPQSDETDQLAEIEKRLKAKRSAAGNE